MHMDSINWAELVIKKKENMKLEAGELGGEGRVDLIKLQ